MGAILDIQICYKRGGKWLPCAFYGNIQRCQPIVVYFVEYMSQQIVFSNREFCKLNSRGSILIFSHVAVFTNEYILNVFKSFVISADILMVCVGLFDSRNDIVNIPVIQEDSVYMGC